MNDGTVIHLPVNIYGDPIIGPNCSIGCFTEIGPNVQIGAETRIGKGCFIPDGVIIGAKCFISPHVYFANDLYPPSPKSQWRRTVIKDGVNIGAGVGILPGIIIGRGALIGMGSVVTKDVPAQEIWAGNPAVKIGLV